jgi:trans-aconitate 2-methyltransferase
MAEPQNAWDARLYDDRHGFVWQYGASLVELLAPQPSERVLDLGCGTGRLTKEIADRGAAVTGLDASAEMIAEARRLYPAIRFDVGDARTFMVAEPFDAVFSNAVLHWIRPPEAAVRQIAAALRPGGRFVAEFGGHENCLQLLDALRQALGEFGIAADVVPDFYYPSIPEYTTLLDCAGLETTSAWLFDRPTPLEGPEGLRNWVLMFVGKAPAAVAASRREAFFARLEELARRSLYKDGGWFADYRRLRVIAVRRGPARASR